MSKFYIKQISVTGDTVKTAYIDFQSGLNIVCGPSNTGKSYVAGCIDFMLGCDTKDFRIEKNTGYNCVNMTLDTIYGDIYLTRKLGESPIYVKCTNPNIISGKYSISNSAKLFIGNLWLKLMGLENPPKIIKNENFERQNLTLRSFANTFFIKEDDVFQESSIMFQKHNSTKTSIISTLLFLITGNSLEDVAPIEDKKTKEAKKKAVISYINESLCHLALQKNSLTKVEVESTEVLQQKIDSILSEITETKSELSKALAQNKEVSNEIYELDRKIAECNTLYNRYQILRGQYASDIKRLTFIVEGEINQNDTHETVNCPICHGILPKVEEQSCIEAAQVELHRIILHIRDLEDAEQSILSELKALQERSENLSAEQSQIETIINSELEPKVARLSKTLEDYQSSIEVNKERSILENFEHTMKADLFEIESKTASNNEVKYKPKEYFTKEIIDSINQTLTRILEKCNFKNFSSVYFSLDSFDVRVNGNDKKSSGQGYRAFLNTAVALTFIEYLSQHGKYSPRLLIVDSPILSLKEQGEEKATDGMKSSLFKYLVEHQDFGQTIIIENEIPDIDYKNTNIIKFTKDKEFGRYGFLDGVEYI